MSEVELNSEKLVTRREIAQAFKAHEDIHEVQKDAHIAEHTALEKASIVSAETLDARLRSMNEFRAQLTLQAGSFMSRELFDQVMKEQKTREDNLLFAASTQHEGLEKQIDIEHQARIRLEAQIGTWRAIILFLGLPGVVALLWTILAAFSGQDVTGPNGLIP